MYDVLCLSDCCADLVFEGLPSLPEPGGEVYGKRFAIRAGGGANTPMGLARLGCKTAYATTVGDDPLGRLVLEEMTRSGLDRTHIRVAEAGCTWVSAVLATGEERSFASYAGRETDLRPVAGGRDSRREARAYLCVLCNEVSGHSRLLPENGGAAVP